jgi:hypothetical protein
LYFSTISGKRNATQKKIKAVKCETFDWHAFWRIASAGLNSVKELKYFILEGKYAKTIGLKYGDWYNLVFLPLLGFSCFLPAIQSFHTPELTEN